MYYIILKQLYDHKKGIVGNQMYDPSTNVVVNFLSDANSNDVEWWNRSEPIWMTARKNVSINKQ